MATSTKTYKQPTIGDKVSGLFIWGSLTLLSIYLIYEYKLILTGVTVGGVSCTFFVLICKELMAMLRTSDSAQVADFDIRNLMDLPEILYFKDGECAFEYAKEYLTQEADWSVGLIKSAASPTNFGLKQYTVEVLNQASQSMLVEAFQLVRIKGALKIGDFVAVIKVPHNELPDSLNIKGVSGTVMLIHTKLKPELSIKESLWGIEHE